MYGFGGIAGNSLALICVPGGVGRILTVKFKMGLFERSLPDTSHAAQVGSDAHRHPAIAPAAGDHAAPASGRHAVVAGGSIA